MSILIKNAQLVNQRIVNIYIKNDIIFSINKKTRIADKTIDARGNIVFPGIIDPHVHFRVPGAEYKEDWQTGSRAAVAGGVTTVLDMPNNKPAITSRKALDKKRALINNRTYINYGLYIGATEKNLEELKSAKNIAGIKIYLGSSTGNLLITDYGVVEKIMEQCSKLIAFHSEDEKCLRSVNLCWDAPSGCIPLQEINGSRPEGATQLHYQSRQEGATQLHYQSRQEGATQLHYQSRHEGATKPRYAMRHEGATQPTVAQLHYKMRPNKCATVSAEKIINLVKKTNHPVYICHVSTKEELGLFNAAQNQNQKIYLEASPHHLFLNKDSALQSQNFAKINPPLREEESQKALQKALTSSISTIGTDHAPHTKEEKEQSYQEAPSGVPNIEHALALMLNYYHQNKISLAQIQKLMCERPAEIFKIKQRGYIKEGYFADIVIADLSLTKKIKNGTLYTKCNWSPFAGYLLTGWPITTIINGQIVHFQGKIVGTPGGKEVFK